VPDLLAGATDLGFMILPNYRAWVVVASITVCLATWFLIERTRLGAYLRAGTENAKLVQAFGVNVPLMVTLTYGAGAALAGLAGVLAAPIIQVNPLMGSNLIIVVFAVVVIGGMGSILGSVITGLGLGVVEGFTRVFYPEASNIVVFVIMAIVLMLRPAGLFGKGGLMSVPWPPTVHRNRPKPPACAGMPPSRSMARHEQGRARHLSRAAGLALLAP
jgi:branched-chain amino acid transport system permease protein